MHFICKWRNLFWSSFSKSSFWSNNNTLTPKNPQNQSSLPNNKSKNQQYDENNLLENVERFPWKSISIRYIQNFFFVELKIVCLTILLLLRFIKKPRRFRIFFIISFHFCINTIIILGIDSHMCNIYKYHKIFKSELNVALAMIRKKIYMRSNM